jgi:hypothetical protein
MLKTGVVIKCVVLYSNLGLLLVGNTKKSGLSIATPSPNRLLRRDL